MTRNVVLRTGVRVIPIALLVAALLFPLTISQQAQRSRGAQRRGTPTPGQPIRPPQSDQKNIKLERIEFQKDLKAISYWFKSNNKQRILTYRVGANNSVTSDVKETPTGRPFVQLFTARAGVRARTPEGEYTLIKGKRVLPSTTDALSVWLLAQNFPGKSTTAPRAIYDRAFAQLVKDMKGKGQSEDTLRSSSRGGAILETIGFVLWDLLVEDCTSSTQSASCEQTDASGGSSTVTISCECATPMCNKQTSTAQVPVLVLSNGTYEIRQQTVVVTFCICTCLTTSLGDGPVM